MANKVIQCGDLKFKLLYTHQQVIKEIESMAAKIDHDFQQVLKTQPNARFLVIGILNGAFMFTSELVKRIKTPVEINFIKIASYKGTVSQQLTIQTKIMPQVFKNAHVLILDDICDTGKTLYELTKQFYNLEIKSVRIGVLVHRPEKKQEIKPDYYGLTCSQFIIGFGLDYDQKGRQYPEIYEKCQ